jgi:small-conductance mechanosensitive channel
MNPRLKTLIGSIAILVFLFFYVVAVLAIGDHVPEHWAAQLAFFGVAGVAWGLPLIPLLKWMNR